jgi:putative polymerase
MPSALVISACCYAAFLCFINTRIAHVSAGLFAFVDAAIVLGALALAVRGEASRWLWMLLAALAANFLLLGLLSESIELKSLRDPLIVIAFTALGWRLGSASAARRIFFVVSGLVIALGAIEFASPETYLSLFDVIDFYRAREAVSLESVSNLDSAFFISSARDDTRLLLPFLGPHRVSSIFLEPVSMGNFGALTLLFALSLDNRHWRAAIALALASIVVIVLADARFASMIAPILIAMRFFPLRWSKPALAILPAFAIGTLMAFAWSNAGAGDDLATRLAGSGRVLLSMTPAAVFGFGAYDIVTYDSGYAYAFSALGLPLCILLWAAFVLLPVADQQGQRYKLLLGIYICALLCISGTSVFALKTAGLGFFALGAMAHAHRHAPARSRVGAPIAPQRAPA